MEYRVSFQGVSATPSDYGVRAGQLSSAFSLVNHVSGMSVAPSTEIVFDMEEGVECIALHQSNGREKRYILMKEVEGDFFYYWREEESEVLTPIFEKTKAKGAVHVLGNVLVCVCVDAIYYAIWANGKYTEFQNKDFYPKVEIVTTESSQVHLSSAVDDAIYKPIEEARKPPAPYNLSKENSRHLWNAGVAMLKKELENKSDDESFYLYTFGVVALQLYDGTYFYLSDVFLIQPQEPTELISHSEHKLYARYGTQKVSIKVDVNRRLEGIVSGADVFLSRPFPLVEIDKSKSFFQRDKHDKFSYPLLGADELYKSLDTATFHHSLHIPFSKFGSTHRLKRNDNLIGESISLADFRRQTMGAYSSYVYNSRLHLGNVTQDMSSMIYLDNVLYGSYPHDSLVRHYTVNTHGSGHGGRDGGDDEGEEADLYEAYMPKWTNYFPALSKSDDGIFSPLEMSCIIIVRYLSGLEKKEVVLHQNIRFPLPPILTIPILGAYEMTLYVGSNVNGGRCFKKDFKLYSSSLGFSSYISVFQKKGDERKNIHPISPYYGKLSLDNQRHVLHDYDIVKDSEDNNLFEEVDPNEFETLVRSVDEKKELGLARYVNKVRYSLVDNPFYFPLSSTLTCGNGKVVALCSNTAALSQGQFGHHPLYTFTTDGVWAVQVSDTGTYSSRQPISRDIVKQGVDITQTDRAVIFTSERGVMLLSGANTEPITDLLMGGEVNEVFASSSEISRISGLPIDPFSVLPFEEFLEGAQHAYDYVEQLLILFNRKVGYSYTFSLRSHLWTMLPYSFVSSPTSYPDTLFNQNRKLVRLKSSASEPICLMTRPLDMSSPDKLKTIRSLYVRGAFGSSAIQTVLWGSRDLRNWHLVGSAKSPYITGVSGTPYKSFRLMVLGSLSEGETLEGATIKYEERYGNRQR